MKTTNGAGKAAPKKDPRTAPAPTAPRETAEKAAKALAPVASVAEAEPKTAAKPAPVKAPAKAAHKPAPKALAKAAAKAPARTAPPPKPAAPVAAAAPLAAKPAPAAPVTKPVLVSSTAPAAPVAPAPAAPVVPPAPAAPAPKAEAQRFGMRVEVGLPGGGLVPSPQAAVAPLATALGTGAEQARVAYAGARDAGETLRQAVAASATATTRGMVELNGKVLDLMRSQTDAAFALWRTTLTAGSLSEAVRVQSAGVRQAYETGAEHWKDIAETTGRLMAEAARPLQTPWNRQG
jgi:hypothetical protein